MKSTRAPIRFADLPRDYAGLCRLLIPRPLRDRVDQENVTRVTDAMAGHRLTMDQEDYFDLQCRLLEDYEREQALVSAPGVTAVQTLQHLAREHGMSGADLSRLLGAHRTLGPMILRGERKLTLDHVRKLSEHFRVSPELFL